MTSQIVAVEFDQQVFETEAKCEEYLRDNPLYAPVLDNRKWRLKTIARSIWMSSEGRRVFAWHGPLSQCHDLKLERPTPYILIVRFASSLLFNSLEMPTLSEKAQGRLNAAKEKQMERDQLRAIRRDKARKKKAESKKAPKDPFKVATPKVVSECIIHKRKRKAIRKIPKMPKKHKAEAPPTPLAEVPVPENHDSPAADTEPFLQPPSVAEIVWEEQNPVETK